MDGWIDAWKNGCILHKQRVRQATWNQRTKSANSASGTACGSAKFEMCSRRPFRIKSRRRVKKSYGVSNDAREEEESINTRNVHDKTGPKEVSAETWRQWTRPERSCGEAGASNHGKARRSNDSFHSLGSRRLPLAHSNSSASNLHSTQRTEKHTRACARERKREELHAHFREIETYASRRYAHVIHTWVRNHMRNTYDDSGAPQLAIIGR